MKIVPVFLLLLFGFVLFPGVVFAADQIDIIDPVCSNPNVAAGEQPSICKDGENLSQNPDSDNPILGPNGILAKVLNILSIVGGIMAVFTIVIAGVRMVMSAGDSNTVASSRQAIIYASIGLVVIVLSQVIVKFVIVRAPGG